MITLFLYVNQDLSDYGISLIFVEDVIESLPEHVETIIDIKSHTEGELIMKEKELVKTPFVPESMEGIDKEYIARRIANLNHVEHMKMPFQTVLHFYKCIKSRMWINYIQRWQQNETFKTMVQSLGVRGQDDILELNLHEKHTGHMV